MESGAVERNLPVRRISSTFLAGLALLGATDIAVADALSDRLTALRHAWAKVYYNTPDAQQVGAYPPLVTDAQAIAAANPDRAEPLIWEAIILSCYAKAKGGLGALDLAEQARTAALAAARMDDKALDAGAYTALGVLYYKVPGWPIGFGNNTRAQQYLDRARAIAPDAADVNYFTGDFLLDQGEKEKARAFLEKALHAAPRPGREDEDAGRKVEIQRDLARAGK
jgi:tetratricopeptide (TPR) repeat protein